MAVSIGTLRMDIIARTDEFEKGLFKTRKELTAARRVFRKNMTEHEKYAHSLNEADRMLKRGNITLALHRRQVARLKKEYSETHTVMGRFMKGAKGRFAQFAIGMASVGSAVAVFRTIRESLNQIDALDKAAAGMGESVANMQAVAFAASQSAGLAAETTNTAMEKMAKRIAEAANNTGEAKTALELLNLDAKELVKLKPYEQFRLLADAMEEIPDAGTRSALAAKLFDMEARRLHLTMKGGAETIDEYRRKAEELGILLTDDMVKNSVAANDAVDRLSHSWNNLKLVISGTLAPAFEGIADAMQNVTNVITKFNKLMNSDDDGSFAEKLRDFAGLNFKSPAEIKRIFMKYGEKAADGFSDTFLPASWQEDGAEVFEDRVRKVQKSFMSKWLFGDSTTQKTFKLKVKEEDDIEGKSLLEDETKDVNIKAGMTAEKDSIEEYRFLLEKQQRENQARLTTSNIEALNNNTNAILQTQKRDEIHYPRRSNLREVQLAP